MPGMAQGTLIRMLDGPQLWELETDFQKDIAARMRSRAKDATSG